MLGSMNFFLQCFKRPGISELVANIFLHRIFILMFRSEIYKWYKWARGMLSSRYSKRDRTVITVTEERASVDFPSFLYFFKTLANHAFIPSAR